MSGKYESVSFSFSIFIMILFDILLLTFQCDI